MRLEDMSPTLVRKAIGQYLDLAWPDGAHLRPRIAVRDLEDAPSLEALLDRFDTPKASEGVLSKRYMLRLGNHRYPFMKFVVQEYLVDEEYFFSVDTHDDLDIPPDNPDFAGWQELKEFNRVLKAEIEGRWSECGLPTHNDLRLLAEDLAQVEREGTKRKRLILVDDDADVVRGLGALLAGRGYDIELAFSGEEVLARLDREPLPDLVLLDYSMPGMDGEEVLDRIRASERLRALPVLLATASSIDLARMGQASGLLRKPYPREALFAMIAELLKQRAAAPRHAP